MTASESRAELSVAALRAEFDVLRGRVEASIGRREGGDEGAAELKQALMNVYRSVDSALVQLTRLKGEITQLVERWKAERHAAPPLAPHFTGVQQPVYEDHLGASTFLEKGWSKISGGDYQEAEKVLQHALALSPNSTEGRSLLGWAQMLQDKLDAALLNFQHVLNREPSNAIARINLGYICLKQGSFSEAIEHLSTALGQTGDARARLYANFYLGVVYIEREMYEDAQIFLERSIEIGPNFVEAYFELGHTIWLVGQKERALEVWERGAKVNKFNPWSRRCEEILALVKNGDGPERAWVSRRERSSPGLS